MQKRRNRNIGWCGEGGTKKLNYGMRFRGKRQEWEIYGRDVKLEEEKRKEKKGFTTWDLQKLPTSSRRKYNEK